MAASVGYCSTTSVASTGINRYLHMPDQNWFATLGNTGGAPAMRSLVAC
jgi:hypothetical protein